MDKTQLEKNARAFILSYCNLKELPTGLEFIVPRMVEEDYNRQGAEGMSGRGVAGVSESYDTDYSPQVYKALNKFKRIRVVG